jgi:acetyltransferase-like isoleucine patch superfamily enzyme
MFEKTRIPVTRMLSEGALPSRLQRLAYRRRGYRIADDVQLAPGVVIDADEVEIGSGSSLGFGTVIRGRAVRIGRRVTVGSFCFFEGRDMQIDDDTVIREQVFVGGPLFPDSALEIGKRVRIFQSCFLNPSRPISIGDDTGVGGRSSIFTHGSWQSAFEGYPAAFEPVTIGRDVWLPWHVFILPGVVIGDHATIGAGSVVNRSVPEGALAAGVPAKVLRGSDEWPRPIEPAEQWSLARNVFAELIAHLEANGASVALTTTDARDTAQITHAGRVWRLALTRDGSDAPPTEDVVIQLNGTPSDVNGNAWFALLDKTRGGDRHPVANEVADFLARYGVRFAPHDER